MWHTIGIVLLDVFLIGIALTLAIGAMYGVMGWLPWQNDNIEW